MPADLQFSQPVQDNFCSSMQFLQRTDELAARLGCYLRDLPAKIGISERSMFGYRVGKYPVTAKALRKLEAAEHVAGIHQDAEAGDTGIAQNEANPKDQEKGAEDFSALVKDELTPYRTGSSTDALLSRIANALEEIARKMPNSPPS